MTKSPRPDDLLTSALNILTKEQKPTTIRPWREIMPEANAKVKKAAMKEAEKKIAASGVTKPKHARHAKMAQAEASDSAGVDNTPTPVAQSGFSIFNPSTQETTMSEQATTQDKAPKLTPEERAAKTEAAIKEREAKALKAAAAKEERMKKAEELQARKAERAQKIAARKAEREANPPKLMGALAEKVKAGTYVKSTTGQLRTTDELATALDAVPPTNVIKLALTALGLDENPYSRLNVGQQSMNLRNKLRGAIRKGTVTLEQVVKIRDENGYATAADAARERAEAKAKRDAEKQAKAQAAAEAKAKRDAEKQAKAAEKAQKETATA